MAGYGLPNVSQSISTLLVTGILFDWYQGISAAIQETAWFIPKKMTIKGSLTALVLAASVVWAHPGHEKIYQHAPEVRSLDHCDKAFSHPDFVKRTVEIQGEELARLRRAVGLEAENRYEICPLLRQLLRQQRQTSHVIKSLQKVLTDNAAQNFSPKIHERDYISVSKIDHHSNKTVTKTTDPATLFADAGACILMVCNINPGQQHSNS